MGTLGEMVRGGSASAAWVAGVPFVNFRILRSARTKEDARRKMAAHFGRFLSTCKINVDVSGSPPPPGAGCVVCYNESSFADVAAFCTMMWAHVDRAAAADLYAWFPFGRASAERAAIELVPRGDRQGTDRLMGRMVTAVRAGERLAWGGEGRISGLDGVGRFKIGASLIAIRAQVPIHPVAFCGGQVLMPFRSIRARAGTIRVRFGTPIPTLGLQESDARDLADKAQATLSAMYEDLRRQVSARP
jgi:1-acyl-sn-glycerol-3-phosphate acyltransferase